jgi:hypothetical protein
LGRLFSVTENPQLSSVEFLKSSHATVYLWLKKQVSSVPEAVFVSTEPVSEIVTSVGGESNENRAHSALQASSVVTA